MADEREYRKSIREAMLAMLDAHERFFGPGDPSNAVLLASIAKYEVDWFPGDITTAQMRKKYKEAVRQGLIR
jgi:hypothetical protein